VDGPLLDAQIGDAVGETNGGINAMDPPSSSSERVSRRWYVEETARRAMPPPTAAAASQASPSTIQYSGLDASLLHLSQIWSRGGANISNNFGECLPFQGVMGIGQGANVAGLLPLLNYQHDDDEDDDGGSSDHEKENDDEDKMDNKPTIFQGLQFVILIDGKDILSQRNNESDDAGEEQLENDFYVGPDGIKSLHVIMEQNHDGNDDDATRISGSEKLANHYGPNAEIHHCKQSNICTPSLSNIIGKFLVTQKNKLHSNSKSRELMSLQNQLSTMEQLATLVISQEIQRNPPKALMAVIGPTAMMPDDATENKAIVEKGEENDDDQRVKESVKVDKAVGAWQGDRRRGFGEEGGGAPCPGEFLLREEERL